MTGLGAEGALIGLVARGPWTFTLAPLETDLMALWGLGPLAFVFTLAPAAGALYFGPRGFAFLGAPDGTMTTVFALLGAFLIFLGGGLVTALAFFGAAVLDFGTWTGLGALGPILTAACGLGATGLPFVVTLLASVRLLLFHAEAGTGFVALGAASLAPPAGCFGPRFFASLETSLRLRFDPVPLPRATTPAPAAARMASTGASEVAAVAATEVLTSAAAGAGAGAGARSSSSARAGAEAATIAAAMTPATDEASIWRSRPVALALVEARRSLDDETLLACESLRAPAPPAL